jgi:dynein heavy chain 1, cytosolic
VFRTGQDLLQRQRFQFPPDWVDCDMVEGEWSAFNEMLNRKNATLNDAVIYLATFLLSCDFNEYSLDSTITSQDSY